MTNCVGVGVILFTIFTSQCSFGIPVETINGLESTINQLIPPLADPFAIPDLELPFNLAPLISGIVALCSGNVTGLSTLSDKFEILDDEAADVMKIAFGVDLAYAELKALYRANLEVSHSGLLPGLPDYLKFEGQGKLGAYISNVKLGIKATLPLEGEETIRSLSIAVQFDPVLVDLQDFKINDQEVNWKNVSAQIKPKFDEFWGTTEPFISETIRSIANDITRNCSLKELIAIIINNGPTDCLTFSPSSTNSIPEPVNNILPFIALLKPQTPVGPCFPTKP